ncbi:MAG: phosphate ABC transporter ATP-binding protein [Ardenticatenaceae bacterium]|nr:phosphate ABC transporter ATP-binding protein [Anaerolineales bacterium]MCB8920820.1 phosphate ABC transporter ATP-binding protein [Ardenticatenaceae bacterium]MCB8989779.1 phosphate ABC transporter ATP-binding protein [Ardenticatenaceae bacterium]MCB9002762.1 phosphate ABC transporter ATP-binding protein [Ardenticatenaceae bacterium]
MTEPLYELDDVRKQYNGRSVLQIPHLTIQQGEILALVGPSGAGKSTLLRLLNFLEPPSNGRIQFHNTPFSASQPMPLSLRRKVTTVFQRPYLLNRSVEANIQYGLRLRGRRNEQVQIDAALQQVGLQKMARQRARTLSGGEAQRVALARAIVLQPDVLLLDEPTANLDPYNIGIIEQIIRQLNEGTGATMVLVTHNVFQAKRLAHRVALLLDGRIVEIAATDMFFHNPTDPRTKAFVAGDMIY